jgi:hypothetical protein
MLRSSMRDIIPLWLAPGSLKVVRYVLLTTAGGAKASAERILTVFEYRNKIIHVLLPIQRSTDGES